MAGGVSASWEKTDQSLNLKSNENSIHGLSNASL